LSITLSTGSLTKHMPCGISHCSIDLNFTEVELITTITSYMILHDPLLITKEEYLLIGNYEDRYTKWTTLHQRKDQIMLEYNNAFHTMGIKLGIWDSEWHLVLKYHDILHKHIKIEMEFLNISSVGSSYYYAIKIERNFRHKGKKEFGVGNQQHQKDKRDTNSQTKG
jgi:hypothetical protein